MILTRDHLAYWQSRKAMPSWASAISIPRSRPEIDMLINQHAGGLRHASRNWMDVANLLSILRMMHTRHAPLLPELERISIQPGTVIRPERRAAFARKWAHRIRISCPS